MWAEQAALSARLRQVLQLPPSVPEPLELSHPLVRAALDELCTRDTLLLLRPKKWQPKRSIEWAARLLRAVEEAFDRSSQREGAESREVAAVLFGWRGHMRVSLGEPGQGGPGAAAPMTVMKVHPLADLDTGSGAAAAATPATPATTATPAAAAAAAASPGQGVPSSRAAAAAATPPASGARTPGSAAGAAAVVSSPPEESAEGDWLFCCEAGAPVSPDPTRTKTRARAPARARARARSPPAAAPPAAPPGVSR